MQHTQGHELLADGAGPAPTDVIHHLLHLETTVVLAVPILALSCVKKSLHCSLDGSVDCLPLVQRLSSLLDLHKTHPNLLHLMIVTNLVVARLT
jgi:hypothetical protein